MRELERLLYKANRECKQQRLSHIILHAQNDEMKKIFQQKEMLLEEHEQNQEAHSALLLEKEEMVMELTHKEVLKEHEQNQEAHRTQLLENEEIKKELTDTKEVLMEFEEQQ
ncbi:hypothetical protein KOW79_010791 [Hemibagrus wyckioides]|uniref:Uncharacterized protein n=1 Tax=Hemibagrus wyckioides TaxID=337641 RepID=A0A9D3SIN9_9TELE|nr:hypothetical protein KOW79_010791 [Hemibagrus wyckioides]